MIQNLNNKKNNAPQRKNITRTTNRSAAVLDCYQAVASIYTYKKEQWNFTGTSYQVGNYLNTHSTSTGLTTCCILV